MQIGCDIVEIERISSALDKHGERFAKRVLTPSEFEIYTTHATPVHFLARRYAAKEAVGKAFGTGIGELLSFQDISVHRGSKGRPVVKPSDRAFEQLKQQGYSDILVSISDEKNYAMAFAMLIQ